MVLFRRRAPPESGRNSGLQPFRNRFATISTEFRKNFARDSQELCGILYQTAKGGSQTAPLSVTNMKRILILTGRFGMGHCCAAEAIRQQLCAVNPQAEVQVVDLVDELFPHLSGAIYRSFAQMVRHCSALYNFFNRTASHCGLLPVQAMVARRVERLLRAHRAHLVVSTLPLCSQCVSAYKQLRGADLPLYTYITDIGAQDEWIVPHTDAYFVGAAETRQELMEKGVPAAHIHVCGIPVRRDFLRAPEAPRTGERAELLVMGGGLGLLPSAGAVLSSFNEAEDVHLTVLTGKNRALYARLRDRYPNITAVGYTDRVADYMRRADLLLTKPGGITTFEAIHAGTPLYIYQPFLMQEMRNARYIEREQLGCVRWSQRDDLAQDICALLRDGERLRAMKRSMARLRSSLEEPCPAAYYGEGGMLS